MPFNGPGRELLGDSDYLEESVYCVDCGTVFVWDSSRDCPSCTNQEQIAELRETVEQLEQQVEYLLGEDRKEKGAE